MKKMVLHIDLEKYYRNDKNKNCRNVKSNLLFAHKKRIYIFLYIVFNLLTNLSLFP